MTRTGLFSTYNQFNKEFNEIIYNDKVQYILLCLSRIVIVYQEQSKSSLPCDGILNLGCQAFGKAIITYKTGPTIINVTPMAGQTYKDPFYHPPFTDLRLKSDLPMKGSKKCHGFVELTWCMSDESSTIRQSYK